MTVMLYLLLLSPKIIYLDSPNIMDALPTLYKAILVFVNNIQNYFLKSPGYYFTQNF